MPLAVGACALWIGGLACAGEASLNGRAGLWVEASLVTMNGVKLPGVLDVQGGLAPADVQQIRGAMKTLGLPEGWDPKLVCLTPDAFDVAVATQKAAGVCPSPELVIHGNSVKYQARCETGADQRLVVSGDVSVQNEVEMTQSSRQEVLVRGLKTVTEARSVSRWLGADCSQAPKGIEPQWLQTLSDH
ncbi:MAG TPA: DUF3617 family protein [Aquabacterium sp.]|uniref:DUF3617 domain-containing protein n=1 Tax=Aquabacterium sp. TaxID=1872578 RepID=UPI002E3540BB|nr:DUF3617 family protein [Aquabacterium sp.]HEX5374439.1 DUF3617 family protein [Aquabacterium sp.]